MSREVEAVGTISRGRRWGAAAAGLMLAWSVGSQAALVTVTGTNFDLTYDTELLGLFNAPMLVGNTLFFELNTFRAESLNGAFGGVATANSTISGLKLTAKNGYQFGAFDLAEFGNYRLNGNGSFVEVAGQLRAFNIAASTTTQTSANLAMAPGSTLNVNDGVQRDWSALARIDASTAALFGATNVIRSGATEVGILIQNNLTAYTDPSEVGFRRAFIEKSFNGVQMTVSPVPLPPSAALLAAGLTAAIWVVRRRRPD